MSTDLAPRKTTEVSIKSDYDDPFLAFAARQNQRSIVGSLLKFSKGDWSVGQENDEVAPGTKFVANMFELITGWVRWEDQRPTEQIMGKVFEGYEPLKRHELGDNDKTQWDANNDGKPRDPWQNTAYLLLKGTGNASDELFTFATSSKGGLDALGKLAKAFGKDRRTVKDGDKMLPVVAIGSGWYMHPNRELGKIKTPSFEIVGWSPASVFDDADVDPETGEVNEPEPHAKVDATVAAIDKPKVAAGKTKPDDGKKPDDSKTKPRF